MNRIHTTSIWTSKYEYFGTNYPIFRDSYKGLIICLDHAESVSSFTSSAINAFFDFPNFVSFLLKSGKFPSEIKGNKVSLTSGKMDLSPKKKTRKTSFLFPKAKTICFQIDQENPLVRILTLGERSWQAINATNFTIGQIPVPELYFPIMDKGIFQKKGLGAIFDKIERGILVNFVTNRLK